MFSQVLESKEYTYIPIDTNSQNGLVGILEFTNDIKLKYKLPSNKVLFKLSKFINDSIEYEYNVLNILNENLGFLPHFPKVYSIEYLEINIPYKVNVNNNYENPFNIKPKQTRRHIYVLFMEYYDTCISIGDLILECKSYDSIMSCILQLLIFIKVSNDEISLVHNDLHLDNILCVKCDKNTVIKYNINNSEYTVPTYGYIIKMIDFGESTTKFMHKNIIYRVQDMDRGNIPCLNTIIKDLYSLFHSISLDIQDNLDNSKNDTEYSINLALCNSLCETRSIFDDKFISKMYIGSDIPEKLFTVAFFDENFKLIEETITKVNRKSVLRSYDKFLDVILILLTLEKTSPIESMIEIENIDEFIHDIGDDIQSIDSDYEDYNEQLQALSYILNILASTERLFGHYKNMDLFHHIVKLIRDNQIKNINNIINDSLSSIKSTYTYIDLENIIQISFSPFINNLCIMSKYIKIYYDNEIQYRNKEYLKEIEKYPNIESIFEFLFKYINVDFNYNYKNTKYILSIQNKMMKKYTINKLKAQISVKEDINKLINKKLS